MTSQRLSSISDTELLEDQRAVFNGIPKKEPRIAILHWIERCGWISTPMKRIISAT
jgi:hypothetical protein